jgi:hypothetical protein
MGNDEDKAPPAPARFVKIGDTYVQPQVVIAVSPSASYGYSTQDGISLTILVGTVTEPLNVVGINTEDAVSALTAWYDAAEAQNQYIRRQQEAEQRAWMAASTPGMGSIAGSDNLQAVPNTRRD